MPNTDDTYCTCEENSTRECNHCHSRNSCNRTKNHCKKTVKVGKYGRDGKDGKDGKDGSSGSTVVFGCKGRQIGLLGRMMVCDETVTYEILDIESGKQIDTLRIPRILK